MQEADKYMEDFRNTFCNNTETLEERMKHQKQVIDSFQHYLSVISKSIDEGEYNIRMIDDLCEMIESYYQKVSDENERDNITVKEMKNKNSDNSSTTSSSKSVSSKLEKFLQESDTEEDDADESNNKEEENNKKEEGKTNKEEEKHEKRDKPSDSYYLPFVNNCVDVNKKVINNVIKNNYDIKTQVNNYIKMHMVY